MDSIRPRVIFSLFGPGDVFLYGMSDCLGGQAFCVRHGFASLMIALSMTRSFLATAMSTRFWLSGGDELVAKGETKIGGEQQRLRATHASDIRRPNRPAMPRPEKE